MQRVKISPTRIGHLNLFVSDIEASAAFYRDICGFREVFREQAISMIFMSNGNTHHDLGLMEITPGERRGRDGFKHSASKTPGLNHLGFEMDNEADLVEAYERARRADVRINNATDHQISRSIYVRDPDGHMFEFYADSIEDWKGFYANNVGSLISGPWEPDLDKADRVSRTNREPEFHRDTAAAMQARNVAYAGVPVRDLAESLEFYVNVFGMSISFKDIDGRFAVLQGAGNGGCDIVLVEMAFPPPARMLFGGVNLHDGKPLADSIALLSDRGVQYMTIGDTAAEVALIALDPDRIPLVYSNGSALALFEVHGAEVIAKVGRMLASREYV